MPSEPDLRRKNAKFASAALSGKKPTNPSRRDLSSKRIQLSTWALGIVLFVVMGGVLFEVVSLIFLRT